MLIRAFTIPLKQIPKVLLIYDYLVAILICLLATPTGLSWALGAGICFCGVWLKIWTAGYRKDWDKFEIIGPYRYVRFPSYLGRLLVYLGALVTCRSLYVAIFVLSMTLILFKVIFTLYQRNYHHLERIRFEDYRLQVPSLIPTLFPYLKNNESDKNFSLKYAIFTSPIREWEYIIFLLLGYVILYFYTKMPEFSYLKIGIGAFLSIILGVRIINIIRQKSIYRPKGDKVP